MLNLLRTQSFPLYSFSYIFYALKSIVRHCRHEKSREKNVHTEFVQYGNMYRILNKFLFQFYFFRISTNIRCLITVFIINANIIPKQYHIHKNIT